MERKRKLSIGSSSCPVSRAPTTVNCHSLLAQHQNFGGDGPRANPSRSVNRRLRSTVCFFFFHMTATRHDRVVYGVSPRPNRTPYRSIMRIYSVVISIETTAVKARWYVAKRAYGGSRVKALPSRGFAAQQWHCAVYTKQRCTKNGISSARGARGEKIQQGQPPPP